MDAIMYENQDALLPEIALLLLCLSTKGSGYPQKPAGYTQSYVYLAAR
jgi:hypothetical protein